MVSSSLTSSVVLASTGRDRASASVACPFVIVSSGRNRAHTPTVKQTLVAQQRCPFSQSCLPLTVELAKGLKDDILGELGSANATWSFDDRLLAWLHPSFEAKVRAYYSGDGTALDSMFDAHQCQRLDQLLLGVLIQRLDGKNPGLASALGLAAGMPAKAAQNETVPGKQRTGSMGRARARTGALRK